MFILSDKENYINLQRVEFFLSTLNHLQLQAINFVGIKKITKMYTRYLILFHGFILDECEHGVDRRTFQTKLLPGICTFMFIHMKYKYS